MEIINLGETDGLPPVDWASSRAASPDSTSKNTDLQRLVAELIARGVDPGPVEPVGQAGWKATIVDNDGNTIILIEVASAG